MPISVADMKWRAWYADGSVYSSTTDRWADIPADGIQVLAITYTGERGLRYRDIISGLDGAAEYSIPGSREVKIGTWTTRDNYLDKLHRAMADVWR